MGRRSWKGTLCSTGWIDWFDWTVRLWLARSACRPNRRTTPCRPRPSSTSRRRSRQFARFPRSDEAWLTVDAVEGNTRTTSTNRASRASRPRSSEDSLDRSRSSLPGRGRTRGLRNGLRETRYSTRRTCKRGRTRKRSGSSWRGRPPSTTRSGCVQASLTAAWLYSDGDSYSQERQDRRIKRSADRGVAGRF